MNPDTARTRLSRRPGFLLSRTGAAVQAGFKEVVAGWDIRPLHFLVLVSVHAAEGRPQQELCRAVGVDSGNMVELLDRLEALGYIKRVRDSKDRRRQLIVMTSTGRSVISDMSQAIEAHDRRFFSPLTNTEQAQLVRLLSKLYVATPEARGQGFAAAD